MNTDKNITITITEETSETLAMIVKRFSFYDAGQLACTNYPAYRMIDAIAELQRSLAAQGFAPR